MSCLVANQSKILSEIVVFPVTIGINIEKRLILLNHFSKLESNNSSLEQIGIAVKEAMILIKVLILYTFLWFLKRVKFKIL